MGPWWALKAPSEAEEAMVSFEEYLDSLARKGAWGEYLELAALAATTDTKITVCYPEGTRNGFNHEGQRGQIWLSYENKHYEWLRA